MAPLEGYPNSASPTLKDHEHPARAIDEAGFATIWLRDVLFYDPSFGDAGQMLDPFVYLGFLAAVTRNIALGTAGIVAPLRDSMHLAKQVASADVLTNGRLLLGLASGDRPAEYPALNIDFDSRASRYQEAFEVVRCLTETDFPRIATQHSGRLDGGLNLLPRASGSRHVMDCDDRHEFR
nr:LLM class flavin-dependent oxidoreductase [Paraburkholderia sp. PGU19]